MPINQKIDIFIQFVRRSKKGVFKPLIMAVVISVLLVIGGLAFVLFHFYSNLIENYYKNILYDIYDFQDKIVSKNNYRYDLEYIAKSISGRKGVKSVWIVDRNGKCIYHSNKSIFEVYFGRHLPVEYYDNINVVWKFKNGYPVVAKRNIKYFYKYRLSIPLYTFSKDYYDFILGMDVYLFPVQIYWIYPLIFIITFIIVCVFVLFFPVWYITNRKFDEVSTQAMILGGTLKLDQGKKIEKTEVEKDISEKTEKKEEETKNTIRTKVVEPKVRKETKGASSEEKQRESSEIKEKLKNMEVANPSIQLLEFKQSEFRRKKIELPKLIVESFPFHSKSILGSYVTIFEKNNVLWPLIFSYYGINDIINGFNIIKDIYEYLSDLIVKEDGIKKICSKLNDIYIEKELKGNLSVIRINDENVEYTSMGKDYALYLKNNENIVKELKLELPQLGEIKEDFEKYVKVADIKFEKNDIFLAMPSNSTMININGETMDYITKRHLVEYKDNIDDMGTDLNNILRPLFKKDRDMEETGFISLRFI